MNAEIEDMRKRKDAAYEERNRLVALLARLFPSGLAKTAIEGWSEDWHNCVYINLPTGQASWHIHDSQMFLFEGLPPYTGEWDGHTTEEKYDRIDKLVADIAQGVVRSDRIAMTTVYGTEMSCPEHGTCPHPGTCVFKRSCDYAMIARAGVFPQTICSGMTIAGYPNAKVQFVMRPTGQAPEKTEDGGKPD